MLFRSAISYASFGIPVARISDRGDRRLVISLSVAIWSFFTACCGLALPALSLTLVAQCLAMAA